MKRSRAIIIALVFAISSVLSAGVGQSSVTPGPAPFNGFAVTPCGTASFSAAVTYPVGSQPSRIASGDFNLDGKLDLVTSNQDSDSVTLYLGAGDGTFGSRHDFPVGDAPAGIAVGDFNGDAKLDVVTANRNADTVSVLLGDGLGGFGAKTDFPVGSIPLMAAVGDFNGDGLPDLAVSNGAIIASSVSILIGNGMGGFGAPTNYPNDTSGFSILTGDFNRDGKLDVATANLFGSSVSVFLGKGDGTLNPRTDYANGFANEALATGDYNLDGNPDLVSVAANIQQGLLLPGDGTGSFNTVQGLSAGIEPHGAAITDINLDGKPDLVLLGFFDVVVFLGDGTGGFSHRASFPVGQRSLSLAVGDFNGDGKPDLATANSNSDDISVLLSNCTPNTAPSITAINASAEKGAPAANVAIATVSDAEDAANTLAVTVNGGTSATVNGVTVSGITIDAQGNVKANVQANCAATNATFTLTATDPGGLTSMATLSVTATRDTHPPTISCPANITQSADLNHCTAAVNYAVPVAGDNCAGATVSCTPASGSAFSTGTTTVNCTAADAAGNTSSCSFTVTVNDTQKPVINCPANMLRVTARPGDATGIVNYATPVAIDNCGTPSVVCTPPTGAALPLGTTSVSCTATDASGNTASCSFMLTMFDVCLQDDSPTGASVVWNSQTGDYRFCCGGIVYTGKATSLRRGMTFSLSGGTGYRITGSLDGTQNKGNASFQAGSQICTITDRDIRNNTCQCALSGGGGA